MSGSIKASEVDFEVMLRFEPDLSVEEFWSIETVEVKTK